MPMPLRGLKYRRQKIDASMAKAGAVIGKTASHYSKIEKGKVNISLYDARELAIWLKCSVDELL